MIEFKKSLINSLWNWYSKNSQWQFNWMNLSIYISKHINTNVVYPIDSEFFWVEKLYNPDLMAGTHFTVLMWESGPKGLGGGAPTWVGGPGLLSY